VVGKVRLWSQKASVAALILPVEQGTSPSGPSSLISLNESAEF
jgi:hypothetical protein